jgi:hypothetical protein
MLTLIRPIPHASTASTNLPDRSRIRAWPIVVGLFDGHRLQAVFRQSQRVGIGIGHQHRRVRGHHDLANRRLTPSTASVSEIPSAAPATAPIPSRRRCRSPVAGSAHGTTAFRANRRGSRQRGCQQPRDYLATEKKRSARKNQPFVSFGSQLARSASERFAAGHFHCLGVVDRPITPSPAGLVMAGYSAAIPSSSVDLPAPFLPTMIVNSARTRRAGMACRTDRPRGPRCVMDRARRAADAAPAY